jgi:MFS family permease
MSGTPAAVSRFVSETPYLGQLVSRAQGTGSDPRTERGSSATQNVAVGAVMLGDVRLTIGRRLDVPFGLVGHWYYGWTLVAIAFLTVSVAQGTRGAFGVLLLPLTDGLGWGRGLTAGAIATNALLWAVSAVPVGILLDRWGPRRVFGGAAVLAGLGLVLAATTQQPWQLYLGVGVLAGIGFAPLIPGTEGMILANWFVRRRGLAMGIVAAGAGFGILVLAPLTQWILVQADWPAAFVVIAALLLVLVAPLNALAQRHRPEDCGLVADGGSHPAASSAVAAGRLAPPAGPSVWAALHQPRFWLLAAAFLLGNAPTYFLLVHGAAFLVDGGFSAEQAAAVLGLAGACTVGGVLLWGYLADRWGSEWTYTAGSLGLIASLAVLYVVAPGQDGLLYAFAVLFALGFASRQGLGPFMAAALLRGRSFGMLMGVLVTHMALGVALGPLVGGWVFELSGSYYPAFVLALVSTLAAVVCIWLAAPRRGSLIRGEAPA